MKYVITFLKFLGGLVVGFVIVIFTVSVLAILTSPLGVTVPSLMYYLLLMAGAFATAFLINLLLSRIAKGKGWMLRSMFIGGWVGLIFFLLIFILATASFVDRMSDDTLRRVDLKQTQLALEIYLDHYDKYPDSLEELVHTGVLPRVPTDPKNSGTYFYEYTVNSTTHQDYVLRALLNDEEHPVLGVDLDGVVLGQDCSDPVYCVGPED